MMTPAAITAEGLGKEYRIGLRQQLTKTFREVLVDAVTGPIARLRGHGESRRETESFWALRDVSFACEPGQIVGIIGRNGAGKSTLLKVLSRITEPTTGRAVIRGRVGSLLEVGTGFHRELTGRENVYLNGAILGMKHAEIDRKFKEIVDFSEMEKFIDTPVKRYSSGMYVRLAFAVAAHLEPEILIVDEVLAVGDVAFQKRCLGKMQEVGRTQGRTVLFVSHNMAAIQQLTTCCALIDSGRLVRYGPTAEVIEQYLRLASDDATTVYRFEDRHRRDYNHLPRQVELLEARLDGALAFGADEDVRFLVRVRGNESVDRFRFSLIISRLDGVPVGTMFTPDAYRVAPGEEAVFRISLHDCNLAPGHYSCILHTGQGNPRVGHRDFDIVFDVLSFQVLSPEGDAGTRSTWPSAWGSVRFPEPVVERVE
jgi:lipopolysaccharide transport system ATP-binding protein